MRRIGPKSLVAALAVGAVAVAACGGGSSANKTGSANDPKASSTLPNVTPGTEIISNTVPAGATRLHFKTGPFTIKPGQNSIDYTRTIPQPKEDGYIVGISTDLNRADGSVPPVDVILLHHGVWLNLSAPDATSAGLPERFFAAGE